MTTRIRLRRMGSSKRPFFRVVVADQRSPRDGRFIENIGKYHPLADPSVIEIDQERALHWLRVGAQPSNQVRTLMEKTGIWDEFVKERPSAGVAPTKERAEKTRISRKAKQRAEREAAEPEVVEATAAEAVELAGTPPTEDLAETARDTTGEQDAGRPPEENPVAPEEAAGE